MITKPMLATKCTNKDKLRYPVLATPKLDGIRCLKINGQAVSRTFKPIPNGYIRGMIEANLPDGVDGEIIIPGKTFGEITGIVMSSRNVDIHSFQYFVFDYVLGGCGNASDALHVPYSGRMENLRKLNTPVWVVKVLPVVINNRAELDAFEQKCMDDGYEGAMVRDPRGPYKCGRSTEKEGWLLKIKRFEDSEAVIFGFEEKMHNENEAKKDVFGRTERSTCKEGMTPAGTLGTLLVRDLFTGIEFGIGSGLDDATRAEIWANKQKYLGKIVKYRYQPYGVKEAPRFPTFLGFRHPDDIGE